jgi:mRNA interferase MazF
MRPPRRGEIWFADLGATRGHEQAGWRPVLILSNDNFNQGPAELSVVAPLTTRFRGNDLHVRVEPGEGGLTRTSYIKCEDLRSVSHDRLERYRGAVSPATMSAVEDILLDLLALS